MLLYIVVFSVALAAGLVVLLFGLSMSGEGRMVRRRLAEIGIGADGTGIRRSRVIEGQKLHSLVTTLGKKVVDRAQDTSATRRRLLEAGYRDEQAVVIFQGLRVLLPIVLGVSITLVAPIFGATRSFVFMAAFWDWRWAGCCPAGTSALVQRSASTRFRMPSPTLWTCWSFVSRPGWV